MYLANFRAMNSQNVLNSQEPLVVVTAADENYVRGVAALFRSVRNHTPLGRAVRFYVLDGGITDKSKALLSRVADIEWLASDLKLIKTLPVSGWVSHSTYLRIWMAE